MNPLATLFGVAVGLRNALYDRGVLPARRLQRPVISVGNLSVGGSGKTPFVILLGELLRARGIRFDVLTRGYGRRSRGVALVDPKGSAREFGDEPLLIARRLSVPVVVAAERYQAGVFAERRFAPQLHLLDDGFQHRQLARDFDIVLVAPEDLGDRLLPAGRLRETISALRRAHAVVLPPDFPAESLPLAGAHVWRLQRGLQAEPLPPRPVAFCGIARPQRFFSQLRAAGVELAAEAIFRDHHEYTRADVAGLLKTKQRVSAGGFVTTEKDAVNLGALLAELQPAASARVVMELADAQGALETALLKIGLSNSFRTPV
jgi:tetraacyldisaccharide 4'-kinase